MTGKDRQERARVRAFRAKEKWDANVATATGNVALKLIGMFPQRSRLAGALAEVEIAASTTVDVSRSIPELREVDIPNGHDLYEVANRALLGFSERAIMPTDSKPSEEGLERLSQELRGLWLAANEALHALEAFRDAFETCKVRTRPGPGRPVDLARWTAAEIVRELVLADPPWSDNELAQLLTSLGAEDLDTKDKVRTLRHTSKIKVKGGE